MKYYDSIILHIGGFYIKVYFQSTTLPYEKDILYRQITSYYKNFTAPLYKGKTDYVINIVDEHYYNVLVRGSVHFTAFYMKKGREIFTYYHNSLSQFTLLIVMILQDLLKNKGFILHASGVLIHNKIHLFTGPSEAGKSTISHILSARFTQLADDSVIIRKEGRKYYAYQTPLIEKNTDLFPRGKKRYKLGCIFFLNKTNQNPSHTLMKNYTKMITELTKQLWVEKQYKAQMKILFGLISSGIKIYRLSFPKDKRIIRYFIEPQQDFKSQGGGKKQSVQLEH